MKQETIERKVYPSQLNTKTISARVPVQDYVDFLNESIEKGISLNDWLLMKIYKSNPNGIENIKNNDSNNEVIRIYIKDINKRIYEFFKQDFNGNDYMDIDKESAIEIMNSLLQHYEMCYEEKTASLQDVKTQLTVIIKNRFKDIEDQKDYRKELFALLKELE